ncbi:MAG: UPF0164 family protein, partial [Spirochaetaceae bacterium]|nr:UPF0164 family protein [Spirochaetaceae bacterium]
GKLAYRALPVVDDVSTAGNIALAVMVDGGMLTRFNLLKFYPSRSKNFAIGFALKNVGPPVLGDPLPTMATAGLAYSPLRPLTFSFDASKPINLADPSNSEAISLAAGALVEMTDFFKFQAGLLVKGGNPRISVGSSFDIEHLRVSVNYTLDLTTQFTPLNRISIQASFGLGDLGRAELAKRVDTLYLSGLEAYSRGELDESISYWSEAIRLDPTFDPARESLRAAMASKSLKQTMGELQNIKP